MVLGGTYKIPVLMKLLDKNFVNDLKQDDTFNEIAFQREYESVWSGTSEEAFFSSERFDRNRILKQPENSAVKTRTISATTPYYIIGVDVGRRSCDTVATVVKAYPQAQGGISSKAVVNMHIITDAHFEDQAIALKKIFSLYNARRMVVDANGLGIGLVDYLIKPQFNIETGDYYAPLGVYNDVAGEYKKYRTQDTIDNALYLIRATAPINTVAYTTLQTAINSGKIKFLVDERTAKTKLLGTKVGQGMTPEQRAEYLRPFVLTSVLKEELINLKEENEGANIILKRISKMIQKDKVSSLVYALYYIREEEDNKKRRKFNAADWLMMN